MELRCEHVHEPAPLRGTARVRMQADDAGPRACLPIERAHRGGSVALNEGRAAIGAYHATSRGCPVRQSKSGMRSSMPSAHASVSCTMLSAPSSKGCAISRSQGPRASRLGPSHGESPWASARSPAGRARAARPKGRRDSCAPNPPAAPPILQLESRLAVETIAHRRARIPPCRHHRRERGTARGPTVDAVVGTAGRARLRGDDFDAAREPFFDDHDARHAGVRRTRRNVKLHVALTDQVPDVIAILMAPRGLLISRARRGSSIFTSSRMRPDARSARRRDRRETPPPRCRE